MFHERYIFIIFIISKKFSLLFTDRKIPECSQQDSFFFENDIQRILESLIRSSQVVDNLLGPLEVFDFSLFSPTGRRASLKVSQIVELVSQFDQLCLRADALSMFDLQALSFHFLQALVIGDLGNN